MAKKPEVRMSEGTAAFLVIAVIAVVIGSFTNWYGLGAEMPATVPSTPEAQPGTSPTLQLIPAIEKTKLYLTVFDQADFETEGQQNRVVGSVELIKSGVVIDVVNTSATGATPSNAEFNGGDRVVALAAASGYYASATEMVTVEETLQPINAFIRAAGTPTVFFEDDKRDVVTTLSLAANEVSKRHSIVIERPGDETWYQFCGIGATYNDDEIEPRVKVGGSYVEGEINLDGDYDFLDSDGVTAVWAFDETLMDFDELRIDFLVGTEKDVTPADNLTFVVFDCEDNLQNGVIVYTNEDSADADVGLANIEGTLTFV